MMLGAESMMGLNEDKRNELNVVVRGDANKKTKR